MHITVLGAGGFIGRPLVAALRARGDVVTTASLRDPVAAAQACEGADAVVNLAGAPIVGKRWNEAYKHEIRASRVDAPRALIEAFRSLSRPPTTYVSSSAVGYYGASEMQTFTEASGPGSDFLAGVCVEWEREAQRAGELGIRVAIVRTGIVLGRGGGALAKLLPPFRLGLGGVVGSGRQWYSWIHLDDIVGIYLFAVDGIEGILNGTAPEPVTNAEFTRLLGRAVHRPAVLPTPAIALNLLLGEGAGVITQGQNVIPERTQALGYRFTFAQLAPALAAIVP